MVSPAGNAPANLVSLYLPQLFPAAFAPQPGFAVYAASKAYVLSFSRALRVECQEQGLTVTAVCPGPVDTEFFDHAGDNAKMSAVKKLTMAKPVPVVKRAEDLSLSGLARAVADLSSRARAKKLSPEDLQQGTFTITNPGVFGSLMGTPIIPLGTTAILGLGAIEKRPKVITGADGEETIAIRTCAYFSLSFDHRFIDGATGSRFLRDVADILEEPALLHLYS